LQLLSFFHFTGCRTKYQYIYNLGKKFQDRILSGEMFRLLKIGIEIKHVNCTASSPLFHLAVFCRLPLMGLTEHHCVRHHTSFITGLFRYFSGWCLG